MCVTTAWGQGSVVATLSHDGEVSAYYGAGALASAHEAAVNGDVITLSSGQFDAVDITKAVTFRGAGMETDSESQTYPSVINGDFSINIPEDTSERLTMEGVYGNDKTITVKGTLKNAMFNKCRFYIFTDGSQSPSSAVTPTMQNITFLHCKFAHGLNIAQWQGQKNNSISFVNCVMREAAIGSATSGNSFEFTNCVVQIYVRASGLGIHSRCATYRNSIITANSTNIAMDESNHIYRSLGISNYNIFSKLPSSSNSWYSTSDITQVFKTYANTYSDGEDFALTDEAKATYLGDDGSEVGIHGGNLPFSSTLASPKITKFDVAPKSTTDGKLSVDITVKAGE